MVVLETLMLEQKCLNDNRIDYASIWCAHLWRVDNRRHKFVYCNDFWVCLSNHKSLRHMAKSAQSTPNRVVVFAAAFIAIAMVSNRIRADRQAQSFPYNIGSV